MLRRLVTAAACAAAFAAASLVAGGCELVVPNEIPAFACTGTAASDCPPQQICAPTLRKCVDRAQACTIVPGVCAPGTECDPGTQTCIPSGSDAAPPPVDASVDQSLPPVDANPPPPPDGGDVTVPDASKCTGVGCPCTRNGDCDSNLCADSTILTSVVTGKVCTKPCCASEDCGAGFVCFAPGTGGNYCVAASTLSRPVLGTTRGGVACTSNESCRSGLCSADGHCLDACCSDASCGAGQCALTKETGHSVLQCTTNTGTRTNGSSCSTGSTCHGGVCEPDPNPFGSGDVCMMPCCGSTMCGGSYACFDLNVSAATNDWIPVCTQPTNNMDQIGSGKLGDVCTVNSDCRSVHCLAGHCTDVCCTDTDCTAMPGWVCAPTPGAGANGSFLRCGPVQ